MGTKKILFPLEMHNGEKVHTLEELKEKFDIWKILEYADSGQLVRWLRDRGANDMAEKIESLDNVSEEYVKGICEAILGEINGEVLRQIEEVKEQKEKAEKEAAEQLRIEEEKAEEERRKTEEREKEPPTLLVNSEGIYVVEGNRLIARKTCVKRLKQSHGYKDFYKMDGVVQEGKFAYYLKDTSTKDNKTYFLCRVNLETGVENLLCGMENVVLCGIRHHRLFCRKSIHYDSKYLEILEIDLSSMNEIWHRIEMNSYPLIFGYIGTNSFKKQGDYPCIDDGGKHMYFRMAEKKYYSKAYIADVDLEEDKMATLVSLDNGHDWSFDAIDWGVGRNDFVVCDAYGFENGYTKEKCIYYNMTTKEKQELTKFEEMFSKLQNRYLPDRKFLCCGEERIYWLINKRWAKLEGGMLLMEYNISTGEFVEREHLEKSVLGSDFKNGVEEIFVSNNYLYINSLEDFQSWRFSLDNWKAEKMIKDGSEYKYVAVEIKREVESNNSYDEIGQMMNQTARLVNKAFGIWNERHQ